MANTYAAYLCWFSNQFKVSTNIFLQCMGNVLQQQQQLKVGIMNNF